jgi:hypothetical protein
MTFQPFDRFSQINVLIDLIQQVEHHKKHQNSYNFILGENQEFSDNYLEHAYFYNLVFLANIMPIVSTQQLPSKSCLSSLLFSSYRLRTTANINGKKLLTLKPVVRTQRRYKRAVLVKWQKSFQGLAVYRHEVLMSLQARAKLFGTPFFTFM